MITTHSPPSIASGAHRLRRAWVNSQRRLVMIVEPLNSAIEAAIDRIGPARHPLSGQAKDIGSAAVWMALVLCASLWGAALWARFVP